MCVCMCVVRVYAHFRSFPSFPLLLFPQNFYTTPPFVFLSHPEIRSLNLPLISSVPGKGKDGEGEGIYRITVFRFQPRSGFTRTIHSKQSARCDGVHHHVTILLHATTAARGQVREESVRGRKQPRKGGTQKAFSFWITVQGKARQACGRKDVPHLYCCHCPCASSR